MKKFIYIFVTILLWSNAYSQNIDTIKAFPGIALLTYMGLEMSDAPPFSQFQQIDDAGIFALQMGSLTPDVFNSRIRNTKLLVMPEQVTNPQNYIYRYTEGRYTVFEAEGTNPTEGNVTLYNDSLDRDIINGAVVTKPTTQKGTLIYGPMYSQCKNYAVVQPGITINYKAKYIIKLEDISTEHPSPTDTICILRVTTPRTYDTILGWGFWETKTIKEKGITYGEMHPNLGQWVEVDLDYDFQNVPEQFFKAANEPFVYCSKASRNIEGIEADRVTINCVEFKVIWKGNSSQVRLSIDKIILSDQRGRELFYTAVPEILIKDQLIQNQIDFQNRVAAWIGIDEPWSLDMWGPIRRVSEIVDANSPKAKLYFQFNPGWNGRFGDYDDPARASKVIMIDEFMRRVKKGNVWVTSWLYDVPCDYSNSNIFPCTQNIDFRVLNISWNSDSVYKKFIDASEIFPDLHYGISVQTGKYKYIYNGVPENRIREISGRELLYQTNLSLIYGSKLITPWLYFGGWAISPSEYTGIRNVPYYEVTDKYNTLKDTIAPRLKGLLGKTLRQLKADTQFVGSRGINYDFFIGWEKNPNGYSYIEDIVPTDYIPANNPFGWDMGFFNHPQYSDKKYFMILNRYYSSVTKLTVKLRQLENYRNWNLKNYVDGTNLTLLAVNNKTIFQDTLLKGDANLYSILPVVKYGGTLIADETISAPTTLHEDMTIESGATFYVNNSYLAKGNITLKKMINTSERE